MIIHFEKKMTCKNKKSDDLSEDEKHLCQKYIVNKVKSLVPEFENSVNAHVSISHQKPNHLIWITFYEKGKHENYRDGKSIVTELNENQKKFKGKVPDKQKFIDILS